MDSLFSLHFHFHNQNLRFRSCRRWRSSARYSARADGFSRVKALARTCKTSAGAASLPKKKKEISCKKFKNHLQFYVKILLKKNLHFFQGNPFTIFSKITLFRIFFKNSLQEGDFENSLKFLQLVQNLTPIRKLFCTFLY